MNKEGNCIRYGQRRKMQTGFNKMDLNHYLHVTKMRNTCKSDILLNIVALLSIIIHSTDSLIKKKIFKTG